MSRVALTLFAKKRTKFGDAVGRIQIGSFTEDFHVSAEYWKPQQYEEQWNEALRQLLLGASEGCFIASLDNPFVPGGRVFLWVFYRDGSDVVFQNLFLSLEECQPRFVPEEAREWIPVRETVSEDGDPISEWRVPFSNLKTSAELRG